MKKITFLLILSLMLAPLTWAQVGIGTDNPEAQLHVAGENSTIRVDGLNVTNNTGNQGVGQLTNLMVNPLGDLVLGNQSGVVLTESSNVATTIQTLADSALNTAQFHDSASFALTQRALVLITYSVSMDFKSYDALTAIDDGRAKIAHTFFYLGDGTTADTSIAHGMTSNVYSNTSCETATGLVYNTHTTTMFLSSGTYSIHLNGSVYGGGLSVAAAFSVIFGEQYAIDVSAVYL